MWVYLYPSGTETVLKNAYIGEVWEYTISNIPTTDTNVYVNVARSWKTIQSVTFKFIVNRVSWGGAYIQMSSNNSNTMRYWPILEMDNWLRIRWRTSWSDTYFRTITTGYNSGGANNVEFTINRDGTWKVVCNWWITNYTATGSELTIIQTIMDLSNMNVYAAQNASWILTDNKVDVTVTYS